MAMVKLLSIIASYRCRLGRKSPQAEISEEKDASQNRRQLLLNCFYFHFKMIKILPAATNSSVKELHQLGCKIPGIAISLLWWK